MLGCPDNRAGQFSGSHRACPVVNKLACHVLATNHILELGHAVDTADRQLSECDSDQLSVECYRLPRQSKTDLGMRGRW